MPRHTPTAESRKPRSEQRQRPDVLQLRVSPTERQQLNAKAKQAGIAPAAWMRAQLFNEGAALPQSTLQRLANISERLVLLLEAPDTARAHEALQLSEALNQLLQKACA